MKCVHTRSPRGTKQGGSSYNSPVQILKAAREDLEQQGGGATAGVGGAMALSQRMRPDDPITGEYLKLERQRATNGSMDR